MNSDETLKRPNLSPRTKQILVGLGGVLALLLGALLIYSVLVTPEKQPYREALSQYQQVYDANVAFTNAGVALGGTASPTEAQIQSNTEAIETAKASLVSSNEALGKAPVLADGEGKKLYDAFSDKLAAYVAYNEGVLESRQKVRPVLASDDCSQAMASTSSYADKLQPLIDCTESLKELDDISDADYSALVDTYADTYGKLIPFYKSLSELKDPDGEDADRQQELIDEHDAILSEIEDANTAFASNLQTSKAKVDITETAQALDKYLSKKSSVF